ncbi:MAG: hypothetical protein IPJ85_18100 [Flavobacteriales bacterium]|nr:hypothetical protein [Flavobacteriales bacterium]
MLLAGCEKEITVDLPQSEPKVVVEGSIETGQPPLAASDTGLDPMHPGRSATFAHPPAWTTAYWVSSGHLPPGGETERKRSP